MSLRRCVALMAASANAGGRQLEGWAVRRNTERAAREEGSDGHWRPQKRLNRQEMEQLRFLHLENPERYSREALAKRFNVSFEAVRRILHSKWTPRSDHNMSTTSLEGASWAFPLEGEQEEVKPTKTWRSKKQSYSQSRPAFSSGSERKRPHPFAAKTGLAPLPLSTKHLGNPNDGPEPARLPRRPTARASPQELWAMVAAQPSRSRRKGGMR